MCIFLHWSSFQTPLLYFTLRFEVTFFKIERLLLSWMNYLLLWVFSYKWNNTLDSGIWIVWTCCWGIMLKSVELDKNKCITIVFNYWPGAVQPLSTLTVSTDDYFRLGKLVSKCLACSQHHSFGWLGQWFFKEIFHMETSQQLLHQSNWALSVSACLCECVCIPGSVS